ncbi:hypothetical protein TWF694_008300 [Orbilia ellipsospora]|uniref:Uncharacterized protein n=1 Tax=Orbilia ellipsospora TaxID=2528407 RepID=A0AAV9XG37_9PEZI
MNSIADLMAISEDVNEERVPTELPWPQSNISTEIDNATLFQRAAKLSAWANMKAANIQRNSTARVPGHLLYRVPELRGEDEEFYLPVIKIPEYFPKTVAAFVSMSVENIRYLLEFYHLRPYFYDQFESSFDDEANVEPIGLTDQDIEAERFSCLDALARHIGLKLGKIRSRRLERMVPPGTDYY